ncbi:alpha-E domain-containing protein [Reichenbachiella sp. MALMAid0571]|uniref:alpha-E domain-containing protein n=1 Tax=Reichenbachiella sp. MALMAid0571 TaxID=3143939 RepID=UPI0032DF824F
MLSTVADSLYWLGRYLERVENYARFIDVNFNLSLDLPPDVQEQWMPLIATTGDIESYHKKNNNFDRQNAMYFLAFDEENSNSIISCIKASREIARTVRGSLNKEIWEKLNETYYFVLKGKKQKIWTREDPREFFKQVKLDIQLLYGISEDSISRGQGWYFSKLGQYIERADKTSRILDVKYHLLLPSLDDVGSPIDYLQWTALLKSVTGFELYCREYGTIEISGVVEFLTLNKQFPRSILFSLKEAQKCLSVVSGTTDGGYSNKAEKELGSLVSDLQYADVSEIIKSGLHEYIDGIQIKLVQISDEVYDHFFKIKPNFIEQKTQEQ